MYESDLVTAGQDR